ncbi:hypothetical protein CBS147322_2055 [Aspergillus niger]|nr:hypothetical protein CBS147322_2055 [Aspergillus niger]
MRVLFPFGHLLRSFLLTSLIASIVTSAYLDAFLRGLHSNLFIRSIPGSLATAPQGAVGYYQPPPGPAVTYPYRVLTTSAPSNEETAATTRRRSSSNGFVHTATSSSPRGAFLSRNNPLYNLLDKLPPI